MKQQTTYEVYKTDVLLIGGGLAGATAALKARESGAQKITLVSKGKLGKDGISTFGAGVFQPSFPDDDKEALFKMYTSEDEWGGGLCDEPWLQVYLDESFERLLDLERWGVKWEKSAKGEFERLKGRWNLPMAMFHGPQMMTAMAKTIRRQKVEVVGHTMITDLLIQSGESGGRVVGAIGFDVRTAALKLFQTRAVVLAAGGCAFKGRYVGHAQQSGDACAIAYRAGIELGRFEIGDILHTTATRMDLQGLNMFVGLGGKFLNYLDERFMQDYDPQLGDLASMARVAEASAMEVRAGRGPIYLDMRHFNRERVAKLKKVLPLPSKIMEQEGVIVGDKIQEKMEWAPTFFGTVAAGGGVITNIRAETSMPGLFACGDAMARPKHFPKAMVGAAVSGYRAGVYAAKYAKKTPQIKPDQEQVQALLSSIVAPLNRKQGVDPDHLIVGILEALLPYEVTVISRGDRMQNAIKQIERMKNNEIPFIHASNPHSLRVAHEVINMMLSAEMYLKSRLLREDSRDGCLREDFPFIDNINWLKWTSLKQKDGKMSLWTEDIPLSPEAAPPKNRRLHPIFAVAKSKGIKWG